MNGLLLAGCTLAGGIAGMTLCDVAARLPANRSVAPPGAGAEAGPGLMADTAGAPETALLEPASGEPTATANQVPDLARHQSPVPPVTSGPPGAGSPRTGSPATGSPAADTPGTPGPVATVSAPPSTAVRVAAGVVTGGLLLAAAIRFGATPALAPYCVLFCGLVALSVTDLQSGLVPRRFLYPWAALVALGLVGASAAGDDWHALWVSVLCGLAVFAFFFVVWYLAPRGMGFGDVRLAGVIGLALGWLGPLHVYLAFLAAFVLGAVYGLVAMMVTGRGRRTRFAFAPALSAGAVVGVLWGGPIIHAWLGHGS